MTWTVLLPVKARGERKTRLAARLDVAARDALVERMFDRAVAAVEATGQVSQILVVSPAPPAGRAVGWVPDRARGLNAELAAADAMLGRRPLLVLLPDLPCLTVTDVRVLLDAATRSGMALAVDRHKRGTNAIAIADRRALHFRFGADSWRRFATDAGTAVETVDRPSLALDCDTPEDLDLSLQVEPADFAA